MKKLILIVFMFILFVGLVNATSSSLFVTHLSNLIYQDCQNKDLTIKENYIFYTSTNKSLTILKWPYSPDNVHRIIEILGDYEPYEFFQGNCENKGVSISGIPGCKILSCGDKYLDVNQYIYFWNNIRVDVPKEEFNYNYAQTNAPNSQAIAGNNNQATQKNNSWFVNVFWSEGTIGGAILTIILSGIVWVFRKIVYNKWKKKKKNKQKIKKDLQDEQ